ncbi:MAG TPA: winged helix-turn-helix domain-containing protein [Myxococcota bacterium]|nr:winged helix-turn-helix domain-containing protein [Myxococcota bacterium]
MIYAFGECELDEARRSLHRRGREVRLQPKVLDLLLFLLRHRERVVPKEVLFRELWPDVVVTDASLTRLVKEARRALGDDGRRQRVLRTSHGRGYRFAAAATVRNGAGQSEEERRIDLARRSLEAAIEYGGIDLRQRVREFTSACLGAIEIARSGRNGSRMPA